MNRSIILASTSPRRKQLLTEAGLVFEIAESNYEEDLTLPLKPEDLALELSRGKAQAVAKLYPDAIIIAADTMVVYENQILGKPHTATTAKAMLSMLNGRKNLVITGFTVIDTKTNRIVSKAVTSTVYFKQLTPKQIAEYVATGEPLDKAGAYAVQGHGSALIEKIEGDRLNIVGLPMNDLLSVLKDFGVVVKK
ncbi:MAG: septum formation inhibitor Maf [Candidatus Buchananbacteria bacterium]|nr:septum formation inhibitor Maf [Candidatus Buchananbacteria bacterium]